MTAAGGVSHPGGWAGFIAAGPCRGLLTFGRSTGSGRCGNDRHQASTKGRHGANTATLLAYSGHTSIASLARYARVSPEALARWQQARDPATRRR